MVSGPYTQGLERIYWEEGEKKHFCWAEDEPVPPVDGRSRKPKPDKQAEEDHAEKIMTRMEIDYLKKLNALVLEKILKTEAQVVPELSEESNQSNLPDFLIARSTTICTSLRILPNTRW